MYREIDRLLDKSRRDLKEANEILDEVEAIISPKRYPGDKNPNTLH